MSCAISLDVSGCPGVNRHRNRHQHARQLGVRAWCVRVGAAARIRVISGYLLNAAVVPGSHVAVMVFSRSQVAL